MSSARDTEASSLAKRLGDTSLVSPRVPLILQNLILDGGARVYSLVAVCIRNKLCNESSTNPEGSLREISPFPLLGN